MVLPSVLSDIEPPFERLPKLLLLSFFVKSTKALVEFSDRI